MPNIIDPHEMRIHSFSCIINKIKYVDWVYISIHRPRVEQFPKIDYKILPMIFESHDFLESNIIFWTFWYNIFRFFLFFSLFCVHGCLALVSKFLDRIYENYIKIIFRLPLVQMLKCSCLINFLKIEYKEAKLLKYFIVKKILVDFICFSIFSSITYNRTNLYGMDL